MASAGERDFLAPLWRRIALVAVIAVWFAYETFFIREQLWILIVGVMLVYAVWTYLIRWDRAGRDAGNAPGAGDGGA